MEQERIEQLNSLGQAERIESGYIQEQFNLPRGKFKTNYQLVAETRKSIEEFEMQPFVSQPEGAIDYAGLTKELMDKEILKLLPEKVARKFIN